MDVIKLFLESLILNIIIWARSMPSFVTIAIAIDL